MINDTTYFSHFSAVFFHLRSKTFFLTVFSTSHMFCDTDMTFDLSPMH